MAVYVAAEVRRDPRWCQPGHQIERDSRPILEALGFEIIPQVNYRVHCYPCNLPVGWTFVRNGYWTHFIDSAGDKILSQFDRNNVHFLNVKVNLDVYSQRTRP